VEHDGQSIDWTPLAASRRAGQSLLKVFNQDGASAAGKTGWRAFKVATSAAHSLLGNNFGLEIESLASALGVDRADVLVANLGYELGQVACSTFVVSTPRGPLHARNLDWCFPRDLLRRHTSVVRVAGAPAGAYAMVTWPGVFGGLTAVAPGRFSVTVNFVRHAHQSTVLSALGRIRSGWPVSWAVRQVLDTKKSYAAAVRYLKSVPLLAPVLFTVAGINNDEQVVIEREVDGGVARASLPGTCVTNHYLANRLAPLNAGDEDDELFVDSDARLNQLLRSVGPGLDGGKALKLLSHRALMHDITAQQVAMSAARSELLVRVPGGRAEAIDL
jgi:acid ceramidase